MTDIGFYEVCLDALRKRMNKLDETARKDLAIVSEIDSEILSLIRKRNYILYGLNCRAASVKVARSCIGANVADITAAYEKNGFKDGTVAAAVARIRRLFFDDTRDEFRRFNCVSISYSDYSGDSIAFVFEDADGHWMKITFGIHAAESNCLYTKKYLTGYIYFSASESQDDEYSVIMRSFSLDTIRDSVLRWVNGGYRAEPYEFERGTLIERAEETFDDFESLYAYSCRGAV